MRLDDSRMTAEPLSLAQFLRTNAESQSLALTSSGHTLTYQQLIDVAYQCAGTLRKIPVQQWALACDHCQDFTVGLLALSLAGKDICLPANSQPGTLADMSHHAPALLTTGDGAGFSGQIENLKALQSRDCSTRSPDDRDQRNHDPALIFFTSGSSGQPKAIHKRLGQLIAEVNALELLWGDVLGSSTVLACVSHQHIYGVLFRVLWPLLSGRTVHTEQFEYPENLLDHIRHLPSSFIVASPAQLDRLPLELDWGICRNRVTTVFSSGAPLSLKGADAGRTCFGVTPCEVFGSTESGGVAWRQQKSQDAVCHWTPLPGVKAGLLEGLLTVASPWNGLPDDESLMMGDKAQVFDDGRFVLLGRADTVVKVEGKRVSLTEIANRLQASGMVERAEVIVLSGQRQQLGAVVVLTDDAQKQLDDHGKLHISRRLRAELLHYFEAVTLPRKWRFPGVLPVNSQGKLVRSELLSLFTKDADLTDTVNSKCETLDNFMHEATLCAVEVSDSDTLPSALITLALDADLAYFRGHFPIHPVLPGVVQSGWAILYGARHLGLPTQIRRLEVLKFRKVIQPGCQLILSLQFKANGKLVFQYTCEGDIMSSGRIVYQEAT